MNLYLSRLYFCGFLAFICFHVAQIYADEPSKSLMRVVQREIHDDSKILSKTIRFMPENLDSYGISPYRSEIFIDEISPNDPIWMEFLFDWTQCDIHRNGDYSPLEVILTGHINATIPICWNLRTASPQPGGALDLYFVEDVLGRAGSTYGSDIPLTWEIALDGSPFFPMKILPDNSISTVFPPGAHTFQVRITGVPQNHQNDGYYHLQLEQCLVPAL